MQALEQLILVGTGGAIGATLRYLASGLIPGIRGLPAGTLAVNVTGSLMLSILVFSSTSSYIHLVNIGMLGSFTTFSTFAFESFRLLEEGQEHTFYLNISLNLLLCLLAVFAGQRLAMLN